MKNIVEFVSLPVIRRNWVFGNGSFLQGNVSRSILWSLLILIPSVTPLRAQISGGTIEGIITDPKGSLMPNVSVSVIDEATRVKTTTQTNGSGLYTFPTLIPDTYDLTATASGFQTYTRTGMVLLIQQTLRVDFAMVLGTVQQSVVVTGSPTPLTTDTASSSTVISGTLDATLPLDGGGPLLANVLALGANPTYTQVLMSRPVDTFAQSDLQMNGAPAPSGEYLMDGVSDIYGSGAAGFLPATFAVEDIRTQTFAISAEYGQTGGAVTTVESKSGGNIPHGDLWYYHHDEGFDSSPFFNNLYGLPKSPRHDTRAGGALGGPIYIPHVYDGRNKAFFFVDSELTRNSTAITSTLSVPTMAERMGNFNGVTTTTGQPITIYNPFSLTMVNGTPERTAFANNMIPMNMINSFAQAVLNPQIVPYPTLPGTVNNFYESGTWPFISNSVHGRIDYHISNNDTLYGSLGWIKDVESYPGTTPTGTNGYTNIHPGWLFTLGYTHVFSPTRIFELRAGIQDDNQQLPPHVPVATTLGYLGALPASLASAEVTQVSPEFSATGAGGSVGWDYESNSFITPDVRAYLTQIIGRHTLKIGYENRVYRTFSYNTGGESGSFSFSSAWTQGPVPNVSSATAGIDVASMLLGTPSAGSIAINASNATQTLYHGAYIQDDWRTTSRLTLNLGLRWDIETPPTERFNRANDGFNFTAPSPIAAQVNANLAANPVAGVPSPLTLVGGIQFAGTGGQPREVYNRVWDDFMPRVGVAFQLTPKTVLRGGYGLYYSQLTNYNNTTVSQAQLPITQLGYTASTAMITTAPTGLPQNTLSNPFPSGQIQPVGASLGLSTLLGQSLSLDDINDPRPRIQQFQFGVQRQLQRDTVVTLQYAGTRVGDFPVTQNVNPIPLNYVTNPALSPGGVYQQVTNPFAGVISIGTLSLPTVSLPQLLTPYPQFTGVSIGDRPYGTTRYDGMQLGFNKRMSHELSFLANFVWSRNIDHKTFLSPYQPLTDVVDADDRPIYVIVGGRWELPVGSQRKYGANFSAPVRAVIGGWNLDWITTFDSGLPTSWSGAIQTHAPMQVNRTLTKWFDTSAFAPLPPYTLPSLNPLLSEIRQAGSRNIDLTVAKTFPIHERLHFDLECNFYNAFNTPIFSAPNTTATSAAFGTVTAQANSPRWVMLSGFLSF